MTNLKERLTEAANYLVHARNYAATRKEIARIIDEWDEQHVEFAGAKACLNALVQLGLTDSEKLEKLYEIIDRKRLGVPSMRRNDYQSEYMAARRSRMAKAIEIESFAEGRPITGTERAQREKRIRTDWARKEAAYLEAKGDLSYNERNAAKAAFWQIIDQEMDAMLAEAKAISALPRHRKRRVVKVAPTPPANPQLFDALQRAKTKRQ